MMNAVAVMDNGTQVFQFDGAKVRVVVKDGEPWFVAKDVAEVLGYENTAEAIRDHCKNVVLVGGSEMLGASDYNDARALGYSHNDVVRKYQIIPNVTFTVLSCAPSSPQPNALKSGW